MDIHEILKQLAEKKISVEEAYKKIKGTEVKRKPIKLVGAQVKEEPKSDEKHGKIDVRIPANNRGHALTIKSGKVSIKSTETDSLTIKGEGHYQLSNEKITLEGNFDVSIPMLNALSIKVMNSEIDGEVGVDVLNLSGQDSTLSLSVDSKIVNISNQGGDSNIQLTKRLKVLNVSNKLGLLKIGLPRSLRGIFNLKEHQGDIRVEERKGNRFLRLLAGSGAPAVINITAHSGTVYINYYDSGRESDKNIQNKGEGDKSG